LAKIGGLRHRINPPCGRRLLRLAGKRNLALLAAAKQPAGQITQTLSSLLTKNIPLNLSGKSVI
jgi:hypothetical protein